MERSDVQGEMPGGVCRMKEKMEADSTQMARKLTASEIRSRVEVIAEELALRMRAEEPESGINGLEVFPLDTRKFVTLMSEFVRMN